MDRNNDSNMRPDVRDDIIDLGAVSIETRGPLRIGETDGGNRVMGISEE